MAVSARPSNALRRSAAARVWAHPCAGLSTSCAVKCAVRRSSAARLARAYAVCARGARGVRASAPRAQ
eukprot:171841-Lingulodinium_polyedra.AAC.1